MVLEDALHGNAEELAETKLVGAGGVLQLLRSMISTIEMSVNSGALIEVEILQRCFVTRLLYSSAQKYLITGCFLSISSPIT